MKMFGAELYTLFIVGCGILPILASNNLLFCLARELFLCGARLLCFACAHCESGQSKNEDSVHGGGAGHDRQPL